MEVELEAFYDDNCVLKEELRKQTSKALLSVNNQHELR